MSVQVCFDTLQFDQPWTLAGLWTSFQEKELDLRMRVERKAEVGSPAQGPLKDESTEARHKLSEPLAKRHLEITASAAAEAKALDAKAAQQLKDIYVMPF